MTQDNNHAAWRQGLYAPEIKVGMLTGEDLKMAQSQEAYLVRPSLRGNAICRTFNPEDAAWIAKRLNTAAKLEREVNGDTPLMLNVLAHEDIGHQGVRIQAVLESLFNTHFARTARPVVNRGVKAWLVTQGVEL